MWKTISVFLSGVLAATILFLKFKKPEVVNVSGDLIEEQKVKDNRKIKNRSSSNYTSKNLGPNSGVISEAMSRREVLKIWKELKR
jgi:hypothetical protein